ncbi:hypothetical protein IG631_22448 [Alternaria alternata]|nr:hypothetical protein IG631_22448 [Alternaria alternata]
MVRTWDPVTNNHGPSFLSNAAQSTLSCTRSMHWHHVPVLGWKLPASLQDNGFGCSLGTVVPCTTKRAAARCDNMAHGRHNYRMSLKTSDGKDLGAPAWVILKLHAITSMAVESSITPSIKNGCRQGTRDTTLPLVPLPGVGVLVALGSFDGAPSPLRCGPFSDLGEERHVSWMGYQIPSIEK